MQHTSLKKMWLHMWKYLNSEKKQYHKTTKGMELSYWAASRPQQYKFNNHPTASESTSRTFVAGTQQQSSRSGWKASALIQELSLLKQHWKIQLEYFYHDLEPLFIILHVADGGASCPAPASCSKSRSQIQRQHHPIPMARHTLPSSW